MASIVAVLTRAGVALPASGYAANADGSAPMWIPVPAVSPSMLRRQADDKPPWRRRGFPADWYLLNPGQLAGPPGDAGTDVLTAQPGPGSPGLMWPGDPGPPPVAVVFTYTYRYTAPIWSADGS